MLEHQPFLIRFYPKHQLLEQMMGQTLKEEIRITHVENPNTRLILISCSQGILCSSSLSCYLLLSNYDGSNTQRGNQDNSC